MELNSFVFNLFCLSYLCLLSFPLFNSFCHYCLFSLSLRFSLGLSSFSCLFSEFNSHLFSLKNFFFDFFVDIVFLCRKRSKCFMNLGMSIFKFLLFLLKLFQILLMLSFTLRPLLFSHSPITTCS